MKLFVGLGNPGAKYARNRHNVGAMAVERIAEAQGFGPWRAKFQGRLSEGRLDGDKALALIPGTYMNRSGDAVQAAARFHKLSPGEVIVFHDDLDLAPGKVRVKTGGGYAGHNGLRSIAGHLGAEFVRVRIGIGHPGQKSAVTAWVLGDFSKAETGIVTPLLDAMAEAAPALAAGDGPAFTNRLASLRGPAPDVPARGEPAKPAPSGPATERPAQPDADPAPGDMRGMLSRLARRFR